MTAAIEVAALAGGSARPDSVQVGTRDGLSRFLSSRHFEQLVTSSATGSRSLKWSANGSTWRAMTKNRRRNARVASRTSRAALYDDSGESVHPIPELLVHPQITGDV